MAMLHEVSFQPDNKSIKVRAGLTILDSANKARVLIRSRCGGKAACLMCKVVVHDQSGLSPMNYNEKLKLGAFSGQFYRLACQARVRHDVEITVPEDPLKAAVRALLAKQHEDEFL